MDISVWQTALGAFGGAASAYLFNLRVEGMKQKRDQKTSGHVALLTLTTKLLYVKMVEEAWNGSQLPVGPGWWQFRPASFPTDPRRIDINALGFLAKAGRSAVITDVIDAEMNYFDLMAVLDAYRAYCIQALEPVLSDVDAPKSLSGHEAFELEEKFPAHVLGRLRDLHRQLGVRVLSVPSVIRSAAGDLYSALRTEFPREDFPAPFPVGRIAEKASGKRVA